METDKDFLGFHERIDVIDNEHRSLSSDVFDRPAMTDSYYQRKYSLAIG
jgi:hypothetical protein